jgi:hypothetical protein
MEESGVELLASRSNLKTGEAWHGEQSSRASGEGASFQAVVEGLSETNSDADVSES